MRRSIDTVRYVYIQPYVRRTAMRYIRYVRGQRRGVCGARSSPSPTSPSSPFVASCGHRRALSTRPPDQVNLKMAPACQIAVLLMLVSSCSAQQGLGGDTTILPGQGCYDMAGAIAGGFLFIPIEKPTKGRGGCSRMTVSPTARSSAVGAPCS